MAPLKYATAFGLTFTVAIKMISESTMHLSFVAKTRTDFYA